MKNNINIIFFCSFLFLLECNKYSEKNILNLNNDIHNHNSNKDNSNEDNCNLIIDKQKFISHQISVSGEVENKLVLNVDELRKWNQNKLNNVNIVCQTGAKISENKSYKGVLLKEILEKAKIRQKNHKDRNFYIVARASDNYKATFSWAEIFNNQTGNAIYVLYEENNKPISDVGEMILISNSDIKTGPRHVNWLKSIEVFRVK